MLFLLKNIKHFIPATLWLLVILFLSSYPGHKVPKIAVWQFDKLVHTAMYAMLSLLIMIGFYKQYQTPLNRLPLISKVLFFSILYGGIMEILQHYIFIHRSGNWFDFFANTLGALVGVFCYPFVLKILPINKWVE